MRQGIHQLFRHEWVRKERTGQNKSTGSQKASISTIESSLLQLFHHPFSLALKHPNFPLSINFIPIHRP